MSYFSHTACLFMSMAIVTVATLIIFDKIFTTVTTVVTI